MTRVTLQPGTEIPDFKAKDFDGNVVEKEDLLGEQFIIYFYPKNDTPGCTQEACEFRDFMDDFDDLEVMVVGVSPDTQESHQKFMEKHELNFPLISDENGDMGKKFGIAEDVSGQLNYTRSTFFCDENGVIQWVESPVKVEGHVKRVLEAIAENAD